MAALSSTGLSFCGHFPFISSALCRRYILTCHFASTTCLFATLTFIHKRRTFAAFWRGGNMGDIACLLARQHAAYFHAAGRLLVKVCSGVVVR
jgi:hypothetical protein